MVTEGREGYRPNWLNEVQPNTRCVAKIVNVCLEEWVDRKEENRLQSNFRKATSYDGEGSESSDWCGSHGHSIVFLKGIAFKAKRAQPQDVNKLQQHCSLSFVTEDLFYWAKMELYKHYAREVLYTELVYGEITARQYWIELVETFVSITRPLEVAS
ncbi:hypothetical protein J6590_039060 [Homalodisca vitripennis]|nr:hypothetical protein J6590_039060 [Homalodisca vitripennis]